MVEPGSWNLSLTLKTFFSKELEAQTLVALNPFSEEGGGTLMRPQSPHCRFAEGSGRFSHSSSPASLPGRGPEARPATPHIGPPDVAKKRDWNSIEPAGAPRRGPNSCPLGDARSERPLHVEVTTLHCEGT